MVNGQEENKKEYVALNVVTSEQLLSKELEVETHRRQKTKVNQINTASVTHTFTFVHLFSAC